MTQELTTTSILSLFDTTKEQRHDFTLRVIDAMEAATVDPLRVHLQVKCMEDIIKLLNSNTIYKKSVLEAAELCSNKNFPNAKIEIKEAGTKYDFSQSNDSVRDMLEQQLLSATNALKERENFLKTVPAKGLIITDEQTGETFTVYPPSKSSTTTVFVTLK